MIKKLEEDMPKAAAIFPNDSYLVGTAPVMNICSIEHEVF
jgi:hypothetical protein